MLYDFTFKLYFIFSKNVLNSKWVYCNILLNMCHCYLIIKKKWIVYRLECQFRKKLNIKCREFQLILQMIAMEINLTVTMTYLQNSDHHSLFVE